MKKLILILLFNLAVAGYSQLTQGFNYQAVAREANGDPMTGAVNVRFIIHQGTANGQVVLEENHNNVTLNAFGLFNRVIGSVNTAGFNNINWQKGPYFLEVQINGQQLGAITQFQAVPYSKVATDMNLGDLLNVAANDPADGQILTWNDAQNQWEPGNGGGGGDPYIPILRQGHFAEDREVNIGERNEMGSLTITVPAEGCVIATVTGDARPAGEGNGAAIFYGIVETAKYPQVQAGQIAQFKDISTALIVNDPISAQTSRFTSFGLTRLLAVNAGQNSFSAFVHNSPGNGDVNVIVGQINIVLQYFPDADCTGAHSY